MDEPAFDGAAILATLERHRVEYVLIGALAATFHGSPLRTNDADICPRRSPQNLERLAMALDALDAKLRTMSDPDGVPFVRDAESLDRADLWTLVTRHGNLDISFQPSGTRGYDDLVRGSVEFEAGRIRVRVASLADVIRSKEAAGRPKDHGALPTLRALLERLEDGPGGGAEPIP